MFSKYIRYAAAMLCAVMIIPICTGCSLFIGDDDPTDSVFEAPYIDNYYVNRHEPICVSGSMKVYKYNSADSTVITMGGHDYRGGFVIEKEWSSAELGEVELPLNGRYDNISFVIGGNYSTRQMTLGADGSEIYSATHPYVGSYPTLKGGNEEAIAGIQFLIDGKIADEVLISSYDVEKRYTFNVSGAESFTFKIMADSGMGGIPVMELTVWEGAAHETGYVAGEAPLEAVKLIRDLRPYLIPSESSSIYYPSFTGGNATVFMANTEYTDVIVSPVSTALIGAGNEDIFFNLEGKYNYLSFTAGAQADKEGAYSGSAWLTVYADGKTVFEEQFSAGELQRRFTLQIEGCKQLKFSWSASSPGDIFGDTKDGVYAIADAYVAVSEEALSSVILSEGNFPDRAVKVISELGIFSIKSDATKAVYDGTDKSLSFSMAGRKYGEGIVLLSSSSLLLGDKPASVSFDLGGKYEKISFIAGHVGGRGVYKNEKLRIYADGALISELTVKCTALPIEYTIEVNGCRHLEFVSGLEHATSSQRPAIGIANITAYPKDSEKTDLFDNDAHKDYPARVDIIELYGFFDVRNPSSDIKLGGVSTADGYFDGSGKSSFRIGNKTYTKGLILHTSVDPAPNMESIVSSGLMGSAIADTDLSVISLSATGAAHESAFAMANISGGGYRTLTFTASYYKNKSAADAEGEATLMVFADGKCIKEIPLSKNMKATSYTVDVSGCERLMFWLDCPQDASASHYYALFDMVLAK